MIDRGIVSLLRELSSERDLDKEFILETLRESILTAAKKEFDNTENIKCEISEASGKIRIYRERVVKEEVEDPDTEIKLEDAKKVKPTIEKGAVFEEELSINDFGRNAINIVKNTLIQKIKTNEKEILFEKYKEKTGELISGTIAGVYSSGAYVKVGDIEAFITREDQIPEERLHKGDSIKALIKEVTERPKEGDEDRVRIKGPVVYLTRKGTEFVKKLLSFEIPEVLHSEVEIKKIARESGIRTKIAVYSTDEKIDAVGACVGHRGNRIKSIVRELSGERVDAVRWKEDKKQYLKEALSPVDVSEVVLKDKKNAICIVPDDEMTGAVGKLGENVKLAEELTGISITLKGSSEYHKEKESNRRKKFKIDALPLTEHKKEILKEAGFKNVDDIMKKTPEELGEIKGLGKKTVEKIFKAINKVMRE